VNSQIHSAQGSVKWHASCQNDNEKFRFINDTEFCQISDYQLLGTYLSPGSQMISRVAEAEILFSERGQPYDMTRPICHVTFHVLTVDVTQITLLYYPRRCKNPKDRNAISFTVTTQMYPCPLLYVVVSYYLYSTTLQRSENFDSKTNNRKERKFPFGFAYCGDKGQCVYTITIFKLQKSKSVLHN
jgi:hypothetical protein